MINEVSFKEAFNKFKPESCVFIVSVDQDGNPNGMTAGWQMKCSIEPPLFAVSLSKKSNTGRLISECKEFVVAVPGKDLEKELVFFGSCHGDDVDKFKETGIEMMPSRYVKPPLIAKATINLECSLFNVVEAGDHLIYMGRILASYMDEEKKVLFNVKTVDGKRVFTEY